MVRPGSFGFNVMTAVDNEFQNRPQVPETAVRAAALAEFDGAVSCLRAAGIEVLVLEHDSSLPAMPDAVFPNNWFSTERDGTLITYPMFAPNRNLERNRLPELEQLLLQASYDVQMIMHMGRTQNEPRCLEGTGSMILDRPFSAVYAAASERTHPAQVHTFCRQRGFGDVHLFKTASSSGKPFYHTNLLLSIGERFALVCAEALVDTSERKRVVGALSREREVITISLEQAERHMCGNILQLRNRLGYPVLAMSSTAVTGFSKEQMRRLQAHGSVVPLHIPTIERVGGGSARCMLAEIFLQKQEV